MGKKIFDLPTKGGTIANRKICYKTISLKVITVLMSPADIFCVRWTTQGLRNNMLKGISQRVTRLSIWNHRKATEITNTPTFLPSSLSK